MAKKGIQNLTLAALMLLTMTLNLVEDSMGFCLVNDGGCKKIYGKIHPDTWHFGRGFKETIQPGGGRVCCDPAKRGGCYNDNYWDEKVNLWIDCDSGDNKKGNRGQEILACRGCEVSVMANMVVMVKEEKGGRIRAIYSCDANREGILRTT